MSVEFDMYVELWSWIYEGNFVVSCRQVTSITPTHLPKLYMRFKERSKNYRMMFKGFFYLHFYLVAKFG